MRNELGRKDTTFFSNTTFFLQKAKKTFPTPKKSSKKISVPNFCISVPIFVSSVIFSKQNWAFHYTFAALNFYQNLKNKLL